MLQEPRCAIFAIMKTMGKKLPAFVFYGLLFLIFILEGWGLPNNRTISFHAILFAPLVLFSIPFLSREKEIVLPSRITITLLLLLLVIFATTLYAVDIGKAFEHRLLYVSIVLVSLYVYHYQNILTKYFAEFITMITVTTALYGIFITYYLPKSWYFLMPAGHFQFILPTQGIGHDTRGVLVLLPLSFLLGIIFHKPSRTKIVATIALSLILASSLLRAGYLAALAAAVINVKHWHHISKKQLAGRKYSIAIATIFLGSMFFLTMAMGTIPEIAAKKSTVMTRVSIF